MSHPALRDLPEGYRRGRPDIVHVFLLVCLDSLLNLRGELEVVVHTRHDNAILVDRKIRLAKNYNRFLGLMESLFEHGVVPSETRPLLRLERGVPLKVLLGRFEGRTVALMEEADVANPVQVFEDVGPDVNCLVGGFPHGTFRSPVENLAESRFSLWKDPLKVWTVASELTTAYARFLDGGSTDA